MSPLVVRIGLVDTTGTIDAQTLSSAAAALNLQVTRDLPQFWPIQATVAALPEKGRIPQGVWPVQIVDKLPPGEGGFHTTANHQPYAKVIATPGSEEWTVDCSHEILEMLVDPSGNRLQTSEAIKVEGNEVVDATGQFDYLVEVADPCEADDYTYQIDGFAVSDFITPHYYDPAASSGARCSFTGAIQRPRQLLPGGYISFVDIATDEVQQIRWLDPHGPPQLVTLGPASGGSLREFVEGRTHHDAREQRKAQRAKGNRFGKLREHRSAMASAARACAARYR
jgi:hypothetical protein